MEIARDEGGSQCRIVSEGIGGQDDRIAESQLGQILADGVEVANDQRNQPAGVEMFGGGPRDVAGRHPLYLGDEIHEVVVGQIVQGDLGGGAGDLFGRLEAARVAARKGGDAQSQLLATTGRGPRMAAISSSDSSIARAVAAVCTLACSENGPGRRRKSNAVRAP